MVGKKKRKHLLDSRDSIEQTTNLPQISPNATLGPNASFDAGTSVAWKRENSTNIPAIGEQDEEKKGAYAESISAFADKYIQKLIPPESLVPLLFVVCIGWIFIQDNNAGNLKDWVSIWWTIQKCIAILAFLFIMFIVAKHVINLLNKIRK